ncbi:PREDICTED: uncharacterized protein LOC108782100 [Cyphomyrmex costatus]|uniref:uncharacterized protein LOC108782100 n=1 Tax=Cyphomyrmex costatus TaxID=456900 RepID=UPI0008522552|nr:PREDICTED: uncharacterized protein LOC108782100 [Cyphomyrmex costatus]
MIKKWLERWFMKKKITKHEAHNLRNRLSIIYAFVGWNLFGILFYTIANDKLPEDPEKRRRAYGLLSDTPHNMHVYQVTGLTLTDHFDIEPETAEVEKEEKNENY